MQLNEFMEKFLPDYRSRMASGVILEGGHFAFHRKYFPEALENFISKLCKEQKRIICNLSHEAMINNIREDIVFTAQVKTAAEPTIDEI